ncbi:tetratricopeptide repeat protein [Winogradskyella sp. 3972H.M.0a.05]|uniref:transglutaminase domain-containing protein n=1 Tax=Winogradskyella sp. 3972H.M.0a.05 TaxID=2950277 RepID=UPI003392066A
MLVNKLNTTDDIENLMLKKLIQMDNGIMQSDSDFINEISNYPDYENYLFSNWMMPYFFNDYIENGFDEKGYSLPHLINAPNVANTTVKNGLYYLQAITKRHQRKWKDYFQIIMNINAIRDWEFCGVFENLNSSGIDMPYAPEKEVSNNVIFDAQSKGDVKWYKHNSSKEAYNFYSNHSEFGSGVHYAQTFIESPKDQRILLRLGKNGLIKVWLNDVLVVDQDNKYITELDAYTYMVNLRKGVNRILVKSATGGETPYFIIRLEDMNGNPLTNYKTSFANRNYLKCNEEEIDPVYMPHSVEAFFESKYNDASSDVNLTKFCLFLAYKRNGRLDKAFELLNNWADEYPKSSFIKSCLIQCYTVSGDEDSLNKLQDNIIRLDPDYYISSLLKFENFDDLLSLDIQSYENELNKIGNSIDYSYIKTAAELMILLRKNDRLKMREKLDELMADKTMPSSVKPIFAEFYSDMFNDDNAAINVLEAINSAEYDWQVIQYLVHYYKKQNRIEEAINLYVNALQHIDNENNLHYQLINLLHDVGQFERSLPYINMALENYPNSYSFTKFKAEAYVQLNKKQEAIKLYETALKRSPSDKSLRFKINDLKGAKNPLNDFHLDNGYDYINKHRKTIGQNNYGINILLNQTDILAYKEGGGEYKKTLIYEITSQNGIDIFKEYNLGLYGDYVIHKSEIVKPNGDTVPADRKGANLVFDGLEFGDVIYVDYEAKYTKGGRFYNDYVLNHGFTSYHPSVKNIYRLLTHDKHVNQTVTNGKVEYNSYKKGEIYVHEWFLNNTPSIPLSEDYMPPFTDVTTKLHVSSIESWDQIAVWYSDIVRYQLKEDQIVKEAFKTIFPDGYKHLSETERAKKIYYYITNNFNYSHVSFRQSGFVPQKPSKTIKTFLGDCKDFSSLYLVLARKAELKTNLVLILTSEYGKNDLVLPSSDFNHCIVKVNMDNVEQYLELTDKYLPFKSLPMSLREAVALEIPYDSKDKISTDLITLYNEERKKAEFDSECIINMGENVANLELNSKVSGHLASYYIEIFKNEKEKLLEETVQQEISNRSNHNIKLESILSFNHDEDKGEIDFRTRLTVDLKINEVGDIFTFIAPLFLNPYNESIIQDEERSYPIDYKQYENSDAYNESVIIKLEEGQKFIDIPNNLDFNFKNHTFSIKYELRKLNELKIYIYSTVNSESISPKEYLEFKEYVRNVLNTREALIKFKTI